MKAGGTRRLNWTGQQWAQTCPRTRLKTGQYTATIPPKKLKLAPVFDCKVGMLKIRFSPPENSCLCSRRTHKYAVCERESVIKGVFVKLIFRYLWVMRVFFADEHLCVCVCVCVRTEKECVLVTQFSTKTSQSSDSVGNSLHVFSNEPQPLLDKHTHICTRTHTNRLEKISKTATQWDYV